MESALQRSVSACKEELSSIVKELRNVDGRVRALDDLLEKISVMVQSAHLGNSSSGDAVARAAGSDVDRPATSSTSSANRGSLSETCLIEEPTLTDDVRQDAAEEQHRSIAEARPHEGQSLPSYPVEGIAFLEQMENSLPPMNTNTQEQAYLPEPSLRPPGSELSRLAVAGSTQQSHMEIDLPGSSDEDEYEGDPESIQAQVFILQAAFVKCFSEELSSQRPLLLSQLNNLYKMRSGEELNYKIAGYEKLRDFLMEIPGLSLIGRGNRMQVRVSDEEAFAVFKEGLNQSRQDLSCQTPNFQMPAPLPESLQQKLYDLFASAENHEIPLRSFLNVWNSHYPTEQLAYRNLGFRDVRGVLSNVPFIEKIGGKSDAKYVLRQSEISKLANKLAADKPMIVRPIRSDAQGLGA